MSGMFCGSSESASCSARGLIPWTHAHCTALTPLAASGLTIIMIGATVMIATIALRWRSCRLLWSLLGARRNRTMERPLFYANSRVDALSCRFSATKFMLSTNP
jgi:hypothetical protein